MTTVLLQYSKFPFFSTFPFQMFVCVLQAVSSAVYMKEGTTIACWLELASTCASFSLCLSGNNTAIFQAQAKTRSQCPRFLPCPHYPNPMYYQVLLIPSPSISSAPTLILATVFSSLDDCSSLVLLSRYHSCFSPVHSPCTAARLVELALDFITPLHKTQFKGFPLLLD